jgi:hypothetical protein
MAHRDIRAQVTYSSAIGAVRVAQACRGGQLSVVT